MKLSSEQIEIIKSQLPTDNEAERIYQGNSYDPFPDIAPALLNSADIIDYVIRTGMILPFRPNDLKAASYEVNLKGKCVYWDEKGEKKVKYVDEGEEFTLRRNSIAFVTLEPFFRLPDYIAIRFNLKITHIYRGLLLGTGPLVDPGFRGRLSIPLHNLTTNDYTFRGGEGLIWMEFTKISPNSKWNIPYQFYDKIGSFVPFRRAEMDVEDYLYKADPHRAKRSSIPEEIRKATNVAKGAQRSVAYITLGGVLSVAAVVWGLFNPTHQLIEGTVNHTREIQTEIDKLKVNDQRLKSLEDEVKKLKVTYSTNSTKLKSNPEKKEPNRVLNINDKHSE